MRLQTSVGSCGRLLQDGSLVSAGSGAHGTRPMCLHPGSVSASILQSSLYGVDGLVSVPATLQRAAVAERTSKKNVRVAL